jgi:hypothetical protein
MLPPHRPFREKPSPKAVIKKRYKTGSLTLATDGRKKPERRALKSNMLVIEQHATSPTIH